MTSGLLVTNLTPIESTANTVSNLASSHIQCQSMDSQLQLKCNIQAYGHLLPKNTKMPHMEHVINTTVLKWKDQKTALLTRLRSHKLKYFYHTSCHVSF